MKRNNFGNGKTRQGNTNLWKDNKTGKYFIWSKGRWLKLSYDNVVDEVLSYIFNDDQKNGEECK